MRPRSSSPSTRLENRISASKLSEGLFGGIAYRILRVFETVDQGFLGLFTTNLAYNFTESGKTSISLEYQNGTDRNSTSSR